jgi:hypothetical protein
VALSVVRLKIRFACALIMTAALPPAVTQAQAISVELDQTVGHSTEDVTAFATQVRAFGDSVGGIRFNGELAWATRSLEQGDAFETAYPYSEQVRVMETYGERLFAPGRGLLAVRAGRYRTPFGISSGSDHAYLGFLRAPLIRYQDYFGLSNVFLEHGGDVVVGTPRFSVETSLGVPADVGEESRRRGLDTVVRGQALLGSFVVGASYIRTLPSQPQTFAHGHATFNGVDVRWMHAGVQVRGEWIWGQPFDGTTTNGGYVDLIVHRPAMGLVTAIARAERLSYDAVPPFALYAQRYTAGARIRLFDRLSAAAELIHQTRTLAPKRFAVDVGLTYSFRHDAARH